jgi:glycosyltransferase involved in cell wall biosynthesis
MFGLVIPVFNEEKRLDLNYFLKIAEIKNLEVLFVDDGSTDQTRQILNPLVRSKTNFHLLASNRNVGKSEAVRMGLNELIKDSKFYAVGFMDSDAAFGVDNLTNIIEIMEDSNLSNSTWWWTSRRKSSDNVVERSRTRHVIGRVISQLLGVRFKGLPYDTQSGLKFFVANKEFESLLAVEFKTKWFFEIELLIRARSILQQLDLIVEVPVVSWREVSGSKLGVLNFVQIVKEIILIKLMQLGFSSHARGS